MTPRVVRHLSESEARELLHSSEWKTDFQLKKEIGLLQAEKQETLGPWARDGAKIVLAGGYDNPVSFEKFMEGYHHAVGDILADAFDTGVLPPSEPSPISAVRVGPNAVYKVQPTLESVIKESLGLVLAHAAASPYPMLLAIWSGLQIRQIIKTIVNGFERVTDPVEKAALETIHKLSSEHSVTNFDALRAMEYNSAYEKVAPSTQALVSHIGSDFDEEKVKRALRDMKSRQIIAEKNGLWMIAF